MSVKVMGRVWDSTLKPSLRFVLLAYADAAEHDGTEIWPGWERLVHMTGYSRSQVGRITKELVDLGVLVKVKRGHVGQRASYRIDLAHPALRVAHDATHGESESGANGPESGANDPQEWRIGAPPPVLNSRPNTPVLSAATPKRDNERLNDIFDTLVEIFGKPSPRRQSLYGQVRTWLYDEGATPAEIRRRAGLLAIEWGRKSVTVTSLQDNWSRFDAEVSLIPQTIDPDEVAQAQAFAELEARHAIGGTV